MVKEFKHGLMVQFMMATGKMTFVMDKENFFHQKILLMKELGLKIRCMALGNQNKHMNQSIQENLKIIKKMVKELNHGLMVQFMKVTG